MTAAVAEPEPERQRQRCPRCLRAESTCWCALLPVLHARTRVLILQHPRERDVAVGTARMAHLSLPGSELRIGVDFSNDPVVAEALRGPAVLLYPGPDAMDLESFAPTEPLTLILVDGTWPNARKLVKKNPALLALPQLRFTPSRPGEYRIRREPAAHCVATIEALAHVLGRLEGDPERFAALLTPFRAMVDEQLRHKELGLGRPGRGHGLSRALPAGLARLAASADRVVCVHGEANAWPAREAGPRTAEIVQWLAVRLATGERFTAVLAPRTALAPTVAHNVGISAEAIAAGEGLPAFAARWRAFLREDDLVVSWRTFATEILDREVPFGAAPRLDLRPVASQLLRGRTGSIFDWLARHDEPVPAPWAPGRGGQRMAALEAVTRRLLAVAAAASSRDTARP